MLAGVCRRCEEKYADGEWIGGGQGPRTGRRRESDKGGESEDETDGEHGEYLLDRGQGRRMASYFDRMPPISAQHVS